MSWTVGHNLAGYMPESDVMLFADHADALFALKDMMFNYADSDDIGRDDEGHMLAQVGAIITDEINPGHLTGEVGFLVKDNEGRLISFWLAASDEEVSDED